MAVQTTTATPSATCYCANFTISSIGSDVSSSPSTTCQEITVTQTPFSKAGHQNFTACVDPSTFGRECGSHWTQVFDNVTDAEEIDDWYDQSWCFVDPLECRDVAIFDAHISGQEVLALSYAPCGNVGTYRFTTRFDYIRGKTIRVAYPPVLNDGVFYSIDSEDRDGVAVRYFNQILFDPMELQIIEKNVSEESTNRFTSPFTACVHDIAIGAIDLCPVPMLRTNERLLFADYTFAYASVQMLLVINKADYDDTTDDEGFWHWVWTPLTPYSWQAWMATLAACLYMELAKRTIHKKLEGKRLRNPAKEIGSASFDAVVSITSGGEAFIPDKTSLGEKIMISGFAIFAWIFMSAYTASFTFTLISDAESNALESLQDILGQGGKICTIETTQELMQAEYNFVSDDDIIVVEGYNEVVDGLNNGDCKGGIIAKNEFNRLMGVDEDFCNTKMQIGNTLFEVPLGTPVSEKFANLLNYVVLDAINDDLFDELYDEYSEIFYGSPICQDGRRRLESAPNDGNRKLTSASSAASGISGESDSNLTISQMILPLLTTFLCTTVGLIVFLLSKYRQKVLDNLDKNLLSHDGQSRWQEKEIRGEISRMPTSELMEILVNNPKTYPRDAVSEAMNNLPDRGPLEALLFEQRKKDDDFIQEFSAVQNLTTAEIYRALIEGDDEDIVDQANEALGSLKPKKALIDIAMRQASFKAPRGGAAEKKSGSPARDAQHQKASFDYNLKAQEPDRPETSKNGARASYYVSGLVQTNDYDDSTRHWEC